MSTRDPRPPAPLSDSSPVPAGIPRWRRPFTDAACPHRRRPRPKRPLPASPLRHDVSAARHEATVSIDTATANGSIERAVEWMPEALAAAVVLFYVGLGALWMLPACTTPVRLGELHWSLHMLYGVCILVAMLLTLAPWAWLGRRFATESEAAPALA